MAQTPKDLCRDNSISLEAYVEVVKALRADRRSAEELSKIKKAAKRKKAKPEEEKEDD